MNNDQFKAYLEVAELAKSNSTLAVKGTDQAKNVLKLLSFILSERKAVSFKKWLETIDENEIIFMVKDQINDFDLMAEQN